MRLSAFRGNTQLKATATCRKPARPSRRFSVTYGPRRDKQRTVVLGDLAAVEAADGHPEAACRYAVQALEQLAITWYATDIERICEVRRTLAPWQNEQCVRDLDDRLYDWGTTVSAPLR